MKINILQNPHPVPRREFLTTVAAAIGATSLAMLPGQSDAMPMNYIGQAPNLTVQQVIDLIQAEVPGAPFKDTVDTIKSGDTTQQVTGIVTTMFATVEVIKQAAALKANFIIAHEPTFYNHRDDTAWLEHDPVYQYKRDLLHQHKIVVWRCHDYIHSFKEDGVLMGVLAKLGWQNYYNPTNPAMLVMPATTVGSLVAHAKKSLGIRHIRMVGDLKQSCSTIALMPGASGGRSHIQLLQTEKPHVLMCGEVHEWETSEYMRDARAMGMPMSLIVLGHVASEEPGMEWLVPWLQPKVSGINVTHLASQNPFTQV